MCIGINKQKLATVTHCQRAGYWTYDPKTYSLRNVQAGKCLTVASHENEMRAKLVKCDTEDENQHWDFTFFKKSGLSYDKVV
jgi:hypothetical protein